MPEKEKKLCGRCNKPKGKTKACCKCVVEKVEKKTGCEGNGGARKGAGRKKGGKNKATIAKEAALEAFRNKVIDTQDPLIKAAMSKAIGESFLIKRERNEDNDKLGKPLVVREIDEIIKFISGELDITSNDYYYITTRSPDMKAFEILMAYGHGKPQANVSVDMKVEGTIAQAILEEDDDDYGYEEGK